MNRASDAMNDSIETEVSRVDETEFAKCYRSLIAHFSLTPEESKRQLAGILRRIRAPDGDPPTKKKSRKKSAGGTELEIHEPEE